MADPSSAERSRLQPVPLVPSTDRGRLGAPLPVPLTSFVGREREVATVAALLRRDDVRFVTLTGPGGVGKTRLALRAAEAVAGDVADGARFVDLSALVDPDHVLPAVAQALGLRETGDRPLAAQLAAWLAPRRSLLVLDNVEQVVEAAPHLAGLLAACPALTVLATSRVVLHLSPERVVPVEPLALPDPARALPAREVAATDAVALFVQRALAADPTFALTDDSAPTVAAIVHRLEGLPLAIELAAARVRHLRPRALLALLEPRLPLLTGGGADQPQRHRTLRDAIAWSHDLLSPEEQTFFRRLAVFAGGFTLEAADAIAEPERRRDGETAGRETAAGSPSPRPSVPVLDLLTSLADKSLLQAVAWSEAEPRFGMLETVREFALERLRDRGDEEPARRAHAAFYLRLIERASAEMDGSRMLRPWLDRIEAEHANVRAALATFAESGDRMGELGLAASATLFWFYRGRLREGIACLEAALGREGRVPPHVRARALADLAYLHGEAGDAERARELSAESVALARAAKDDALLARTLLHQGLAFRWCDRSDEAVAVLEESLAVGGRLDPRRPYWTVALGNLGAALLDRGERERGLALLEEALALGRAQGMDAFVDLLLVRLGQVAQAAGEASRAAARYGESLRLSWAIKPATYFDRPIVGLAGLAADGGRPEQAARLLGVIEANQARTGAATFFMWPEVRDRAARAARAALGEEAFAAAVAAGRRLSPSEVEAETLALADELAAGAAPPGAGSTPSPSTAPTPAAPAQDAGLTARELEVLRLLADGKSHAEIAAVLFISRRTVDNHGTKILAKLDVRSSRAAVAEARRRGIL